MAGSIRIGSVIYASIAEALRALKPGETILLDPGTFSAPLLLTVAQGTTLKGSGSRTQTTLLNTPILERSGQGKLAPGFTIQDLGFGYRNQSGYLFSPSIGSVPYNPINPTLTSFSLKNVAFTGIHQGNIGVSGTYMDISGAKNTIFDGIRVSLSGQAGFDPGKGTGGGFFVFHEAGVGFQILNSVFDEEGYSGAFIVLYMSDALVASNRFIGGGLIRQDDGTNPADNPRGERFVNAGGTFANNHLSNGAFFDYLLQFNSDTGTVWAEYKKKFATRDGTYDLRTNIIGNTFDIIPSGYGVLIRADIAPQIVEKMLSISGNVFNNGLAVRSDLAGTHDLAFGQNYVNGILFDHLRVGGTGDDQLNAARSNGRNWISGGLGNDQLRSTPGKLDAFVFYTAPNSQNNTDTILGFEIGSPEADQIWLDGEVFRGLLINGDRLDPGSFTTNTSGLAKGSAGQIIYNSSTGELFYDGDGVGRNQNAARFAILSGKEPIALQNFRLFNQTSSSPFVSPAVISLGVSPVSVKEDSNSKLVFNFTRTGVTTEPLTVSYTIDGSADASDYSGATPGSSKSITFAGGSSTATLTIAPKADSSVEADETVSLSLKAGTGYSIGTTSAVTGLITDDDASPTSVATVPIITLALTPAAVVEDGPTNLVYTFTRTGPTSSPLTVTFTVAGSGSFNTDYTQSGASTFTPTTGSVTFLAGSSTARITIDPTADQTPEANETVALTLASGSSYSIGTTTAVIGTILNDDRPVITLAVAPTAVAEDGPTNLVYTFTRTGPTSSPLTVAFTVAGSGSFNSDYTQIGASSFTPTTGSVTFLAGSSNASITIDPTADQTPEANETVALTLASGSSYSIGTTTAVIGTISNDDQSSPPTAPSPTTWNLNWSSATPTYNWSNATPLGTPSILKASVTAPSPRSGEQPLGLTALRIDLQDPAISLRSTGRAPSWANNTVETTTETSRQFISGLRSSGVPVVAAMNTAPFDLDMSKQFQSVPTNIRGFAVNDGTLISSTDYNPDTFKSTFLYDRITGARIQNLASSIQNPNWQSFAGQPYPAPASEVALASTLKVAASGFEIVLNNGVPVGRNQTSQNARSALGLTADGRYLTMLTVDRKPDPSQANGWRGATDYDVGVILKGFGSSMGLNLDGGGSTQLAWWNSATNRAELLSNPLAERFVGASLGVVYQPA
jgi:hypothetical protein